MVRQNVPIGEVLKEYGYITEEQLNEALVLQKGTKKRLGEFLIDNNYITETQMLTALARRLNLEFIDLSAYPIDLEAVEKIPQKLSEKYSVLAINASDRQLTVAMNDPMNFYAIEDIRQLTGLELVIKLAEKNSITRFIKYYYSEISAKLATKAVNTSFEESTAEELTLEEGDDDAPVIKLLNSLILRGYRYNASDIHIEPFETKTVVRMRIDGTLVEFATLLRSVHMSLIARIKIMGSMNIAEKRVPQDGHFRTIIEKEDLNVRVSVIPTVFGEKAVMRLLSSNTRIDNMAHFGMSVENFEKFDKMLKSPNGIVYLTGPTGSGKTTTLYMALESMSGKKINISTIEDPVEKNLPSINQVQVNTVSGMTFESGLRALLRQDPDVIMVGETRDAETASISVRAAVTGHLVLSTLHTNNAASSIVRLEDMGLLPYMVASSVVGIVAQRLIRKVCPACGTMEETDEAEREMIGENIEKVMRPHGCEVCNHTGYKGRTAIHEILYIDKKLRSMIAGGSTIDEINDYAVEHQGMKTLRNSVTLLLKQGLTSIEEFNKIAFYDI